MDEQVQTQIETPDEKRKRRNRERRRKHYWKHRNKPDASPQSFENIAAAWEKNSEQLLKEDPALYGRLVQRHEEVGGLEAEVDEIVEGVTNGLRAQTRTLATANSKEIFPCPDVCYTDIRKDAETNGTANYGAIEASCLKAEPLDALDDYYRRYGFRLKVQGETLQKAREYLVLYALQTHDANLDWSVVEQAILDCTNSFSPNVVQLKKLIRQYRGLPPEEPMWVILTAGDGFQQLVPRSIAEEYREKKIKFLSPAQAKAYAEGRTILESHIGRAFAEAPNAQTPTATAIRDAAELLQRRQESSE